MTKQSILNNISELLFRGNRTYKYRRNYRYYHATKGCSLEDIRNPMIVGITMMLIEKWEKKMILLLTHKSMLLHHD